MTECQGCGAWNDASRTVCVLCGTPLAETDEWDAAADPPPLPPLPDGGLASAMPSWLRDPPAASPPAPEPATLPTSPTAPVATPPITSEAPLPPLGPQADPRTFLSDDDFPPWLRELAARQAGRPALALDGVTTVPSARPGEAIWPNWPEGIVAPPSTRLPPPTAAPPVAAPAQDPPAPIATVSPSGERRERDPWETALLVLLFLGVVVAALWALIANGVFSPGV